MTAAALKCWMESTAHEAREVGRAALRDPMLAPSSSLEVIAVRHLLPARALPQTAWRLLTQMRPPVAEEMVPSSWKGEPVLTGSKSTIDLCSAAGSPSCALSSVALVDFLRPELKFDGLEALIEQMQRDCDQARKTLAAL